MCERINVCAGMQECLCVLYACECKWMQYSYFQVGATQHTTLARAPIAELPADVGILQLGHGKMGCGFVGLAGMRCSCYYA
jgi:hypothetical protein